MNISMYMCYALGLNFTSPADAFKHFYKKGIRYGDIVDDELDKIPLHLYCDYLKDSGITPDALVSMLNIADFNENVRKINIAKAKGYIDQLEKLSVPIFMPAPSVKGAQSIDEFKKLQEIMICSYSELTEYAKGSSVTLAIENQSSHTRPDSKIQDILKILESVPDLRFIFDTGNFFCVGEDAVEAYKHFSSKTVHSHFKDWKSDPFGYFVRENIPRFEGVTLGEGVIPLKQIISLLKNDNYSGNIVLEINSSHITMEMLDKSSDFLYNELNR